MLGDFSRLIHKQKDGSFLIDEGISVRDLNRLMQWNLQITGSKTLNRLIVEYLESILLRSELLYLLI